MFKKIVLCCVVVFYSGSSFSDPATTKCSKKLMLAASVMISIPLVSSCHQSSPLSDGPTVRSSSFMRLEAAQPEPLEGLIFEKGVATFKLVDENNQVPSSFLFSQSEQKSSADSINYFRGTPNEKGVELQFRGMRFIQSLNNPEELTIQLVGLAKEFQVEEKIQLSDLLRGERFEIAFENEGDYKIIRAKSHTEIEFHFDAQRGEVEIDRIRGELSWTTWSLFGSTTESDSAEFYHLKGQPGQVGSKPLLKL